MRSLSAIIVAAALAVAAAQAADDQGAKKKKDDPSQIGNRDTGKCLNFYSIDKEIAMGKQLAEEVVRQVKTNDDPLLGEFVNRTGQNLVRNSDAKVPFTFRVIEDDSPNAFALPGGFIFVNTGLLKIASEEDEFAGAVAHEIAHVAARHLTCRATKGQIASILSLPLGMVLGGWTGYAVRQGAGVGVQTLFSSFSRADETEADYLGVQYMYATGYDPNGAVSIFEKLEALQKTRPGLAAKVFGSHPMDAQRIDNTQKEIQRILPSKPEYVVSTSEYHDLRERLIESQSHRKSNDTDGRPHLRIAPGTGKPDDPESDKDDRPTIRRRELLEQ
jgi:beta-barrel assembly-enhancing protease